MPGGFVGVDAFFVISGYLITSIINGSFARGDFSFVRFYARRTRRIFPALFVTVLLALVAGAFIQSPFSLARLAESGLAAMFSVSNIFFWSHSDYFAPDAKMQVLLHTWSLGVEEQFYLVWPAILILLLSTLGRRLVPAILVCVIVFGTGVTQLVVDQHPDAAFFWMPFRIPELALGALLVWLPFDRVREWIREAMLIVGMASIFFASATFDDSVTFPGITAMIPAGGAALIIAANNPRLSGSILRFGPVVYIGTISYSLYLVHWPIIVFYKYSTMTALDSVTTVWLTVLIAASAVLLHHGIEKPFMVARQHRRALVAALLTILTTVSATTGWAWRLPAQPGTPEAYLSEYGGADCSGNHCSFGSAERRIYVLGDSHAKALYAGFHEHFRDHRVIFRTVSGCPFFTLDHSRSGTYRQRAQCDEGRIVAFTEIATTRPEMIIIGQMWGIARRGMQDADGSKIDFNSDVDFAEYVASEINRIALAFPYSKIVVAGPVPQFGNIGSPRDCASRPFLKPTVCESRPRSTIPSLAPVLRTSIDQSFFDPFAALCSASVCFNFVQGKPIYSDGNHLSKWGSERVIGELRRELFSGSLASAPM